MIWHDMSVLPDKFIYRVTACMYVCMGVYITCRGTIQLGECVPFDYIKSYKNNKFYVKWLKVYNILRNTTKIDKGNSLPAGIIMYNKDIHTQCDWQIQELTQET